MLQCRGLGGYIPAGVELGEIDRAASLGGEVSAEPRLGFVSTVSAIFASIPLASAARWISAAANLPGSPVLGSLVSWRGAAKAEPTNRSMTKTRVGKVEWFIEKLGLEVVVATSELSRFVIIKSLVALTNETVTATKVASNRNVRQSLFGYHPNRCKLRFADEQSTFYALIP